METGTKLPILETCGRYQVLLYVWNSLYTLMLISSYGFMIFGGINNQCTVATDGINMTINETLNTSVAICTPQFQSVVEHYNLTGSRRSTGATLTSVQMIGTMLGPLPFGWAADRWGRKITFLVTLIALNASTLASAFVEIWQLHTVCRFFIGLFGAGSQITSLTLINECCPSQYRAWLYFPGQSLGFIWLAILAMLTKNWKTLTLFSTAVTPIILLLTLMLSESPKWLAERHRFDDAVRALKKIGQFNGKKFRNASNGCDILEYNSTLMTEYDSTTKVSSYTYLDLFYRKAATGRSIILMTDYFACGCIFYMLNFNMSSISGTVALNLIYVNLIRMFFDASIPLLDKFVLGFGRKTMLQIGFGCTSVGLLLKVISHSINIGQSSGLINTIGSFVGICTIGFTWSALTLLAAEIFPTAVRSMGFSICCLTSSLGITLSPYIPLLSYYFAALPYITTLSLVVICLISTSCCLPETKGMSLPDMPSDYLPRIACLCRR